MFLFFRWKYDRSHDSCLPLCSLHFETKNRDPSSAVEFSDILYDNAAFVRALSNALTDSGIIIAQVGEQDQQDDPGMEYSRRNNEHAFVEHLYNNGFAVTKDYAESHGRFMAPWRFIINFKDRETLVKWYANDAEVDIQISKQLLRTKSGNIPLQFFDGGTMQTYQQPDRPSQNVYCRSGSPKPALCALGQGFDPEVENIPLSSLEVKASIIETAGLGVYFKESARKGSYLGIEESVHSILFKPSTYDNVESMKKFGLKYFKAWEKYNEGYGYAHTFFGDVGHSVDPSILTFMNHGCNGTYSVGFATEVTEISTVCYAVRPGRVMRFSNQGLHSSDLIRADQH